MASRDEDIAIARLVRRSAMAIKAHHVLAGRLRQEGGDTGEQLANLFELSAALIEKMVGIVQEQNRRLQVRQQKTKRKGRTEAVH